MDVYKKLVLTVVFVVSWIIFFRSPAPVSAQNFCTAACNQTSVSCTNQTATICEQRPDPCAVCLARDAFENCTQCLPGNVAVNCRTTTSCVNTVCCTVCSCSDCGGTCGSGTSGTIGDGACTTTCIPAGCAPGGPYPCDCTTSCPSAGDTGGGGGGGGGGPTCTEGGPYYGGWTSCSGSPATKTRAVNYDCQTGSIQTASCVGNIQARAAVVSSADTSCTAINASSIGVSGAIHGFTPSSASQPAPQTQTGNTFVTFSTVVGGTYILSPTISAGYSPARACWTRTANVPTSGEGFTTTLSVPTDGELLTWNVGYTAGLPWVQTQEGNVYAAGTLTSYVADLASPRSLILDGSGGYPGVAIYGTSYDFDVSGLAKGESYVSSTDWLVNETHIPVVNYYEYFRIKLGGPITPSTVQEMGSPQESMSKPPSRTTPYYVVGDMTTSGDWVVGEGETVIFIVTGNLTLGGKVNITGSGFVSFIVSGNITVSPSVGVPYTSSTPAIEGIYVTSPTGSFQTGTSTVVGKERLVAKGIFVAGGFLLQRDLDSVDANPTTSSELFIYNPRLLFSMPDSLRYVPITWEEVAP